ncbi:IclR family transcriptional regulator [Bradyrhizobium sp. UNPF46]|uniref:IclR family transcriptional regulator n=1 Tax=Bradyrhizobium sp. UNPF46 TaxID=1141168 RepID=UPI00114EF476|nr:IclR family transcriptional regulator [Bradyrhizobium sp. UNPF46]TQF42968.1 IclR family transcriptional regulator [Bradyrhizobium sp. UNPF46]
MARPPSRSPHPTSAAAVLAESADDAAFATTLAKGLVVLEAFKAGSTLLGNMELSTLTGIPRPTVARLTHTLAELGYLRYDPARAKYHVGARALRLAHPLLADLQFRQFARPMMQELAQSVRGTVSIGQLDATSMIYVETARSGDVGPHAPDIGMPIPVVMTAMGRAAASTLPPPDAARLERRIAAEDSELWSAFQDRYRAGLAQCVSRGFCTCWGEYMASIHAVAAPLFHATETRQSFSINCGIPAFRLQPGQLESEIGPRLAALADSIRAIVGQAAPALPARKTKKINTGT